MICVDASVGVKWVLVEEHTDQALDLYQAAVAAGEPAVAPSLLAIEVTNIIRQRVRRGLLTLDDASKVLTEFLSFPVILATLPSPHTDAMRVANGYDLPATYDAYYLALAEAIRAPLWTADQRLLNALAGRLPFVRSLADYLQGIPPSP
jgi:predicted nucleic acid-binding protein